MPLGGLPGPPLGLVQPVTASHPPAAEPSRKLFDPESPIPRIGRALATDPALVAAWNALRSAYAAVESVHLRARVTVRLTSEFETVERAVTSHKNTFEYWQEGDRYRINVRTHPDLGFAPDVDVAFDGHYHQILKPAYSYLTYKVGDRGADFAALPNPFFLPLFFLQPDGIVCYPCVLRLEDVQDKGLWRHREAAAGVLETGSMVSVGGWLEEGRVVRFKLTLDPARGDWPLIRIEHDRGAYRTTIEFANMTTRENWPLAFPSEIVLRGYLEGGERPIAVARYFIEELTINESFAGQGVFSIPFDEVPRVWDEDAREWVKDE